MKNKYKGKYKKLGEPIVVPPLSYRPITVMTSEEEKIKITKDLNSSKLERAGIVTVERLKKLDMLIDWHNIDKRKDNSWLELAYKLAVDYLPGFQIKEINTSGRHEKWNEFKLLKLYFDVKKKIEEKKAKNLRYSQKSICNSLSHEYGLDGTTLNNRYIDAKKSSLVQWAANIMSLNQLEKFVEITKNATMPKK